MDQSEHERGADLEFVAQLSKQFDFGADDEQV